MSTSPEPTSAETFNAALTETHRAAEARGAETIAAFEAAHREAEARADASFKAIEAAASAVEPPADQAGA